MKTMNLAFIGLDAGRFGGWLNRHRRAPVVIRDTLGLSLSNPCLAIPASETGSGTLDLLEDSRVRPFLEEHHVTHLVVFKPSHRVNVWAEANGFTLVGGDVGLAQRLENKVQFSEMAITFGLPVPPTEILKAPFPPWKVWAEKYGEQAVLQRARGHSGQGTYWIDSPEALAELSDVQRGRWRVSPFLRGDTWTCNGVMDGKGNARLGSLYQQRTGDSRCTSKPLGACGNQWSTAECDPRLMASVSEAVRFLKMQGFQGVFGLDLLLPEDGTEARIIEVNPRLTSGFSMEGMLGIWDASTDLMEALLASEGGATLQNTPVIPSSAAAAQAVVYGHHTEESPIQQTVQSGRYTRQDGLIRLLEPSSDLALCGPDEAIILARSKGQRVGAHGELARVQVWGGEPELTDWLPWLRQNVWV